MMATVSSASNCNQLQMHLPHPIAAKPQSLRAPFDGQSLKTKMAVSRMCPNCYLLGSNLRIPKSHALSLPSYKPVGWMMAMSVMYRLDLLHFHRAQLAPFSGRISRRMTVCPTYQRYYLLT